MFDASRAVRRVARRALLSLVLLVPVGAAFGGDEPALAQFEQSLDEVVPGLAQKYRTPGVAIALIHKAAASRFHLYGVSDAATGSPVTPDTAFQVGSISKLVTGVVAAKLAERGDLDYDLPITRYLHAVALDPHDDWPLVTVRRLLSHSAGLAPVSYLGHLDPDSLPTLAESLTGRGSAARIVRRPGLAWQYSGANYVLIQQALEEMTGLSFAELAKRELFDPLRLAHATFEAVPKAGLALAATHNPDGSRSAHRYFSQSAAAGLMISARDLVTLTRAVFLRGDPKPIISRTTRALLTTPISPATTEPALSGIVMALAPEATTEPLVSRYGPGTLVFSLPDGRRVVGHGGSIWGTKAWVATLPETGDAVVVLANGEAGNGVVFNVMCRWRRALDGASRAHQDLCQEHGHSYLQMLYATGGIDAAVKGMRSELADPRGRMFITDRTAGDVAGSFVAFSSAATRDQANANALRFAALNAELFADSAYAHSALAAKHIARGDLAAGRREIDRALYLNPSDARLIELLTDSLRPAAP